mmetsp:Transcript_24859/g.58363  ORF Transcript_24859/g.58363 Transcript_24859/m.58363 type:complete len:533 (-) Transcript_24859:1920-3518(-)
MISALDQGEKWGYHGEIQVINTAGTITRGILRARLDTNRSTTISSSNGSETDDAPGIVHLCVMAAIGDQLRGWSCSHSCNDLSDKLFDSSSNPKGAARVWNQFISFLSPNEDSNNTQKTGSSNNAKIRVEWKLAPSSSSEAEALLLEVIQQTRMGLNRKIWNASLSTVSSSTSQTETELVFESQCIGGLLQSCQRQKAQTRALERELEQANGAIRDWKQTAKTLQEGWQNQKGPLLKNFVMLYQSKQEQILQLQKQVTDLQSSLNNNHGALYSGGETRAHDEPDDINDSYVALQAAAAVKKRKPTNSAVAHPETALNTSNKRRRNPVTSAKEYTDVDDVLNDSTIFSSQKEGAKKKPPAKQKPELPKKKQAPPKEKPPPKKAPTKKEEPKIENQEESDTDIEFETSITKKPDEESSETDVDMESEMLAAKKPDPPNDGKSETKKPFSNSLDSDSDDDFVALFRKTKKSGITGSSTKDSSSSPPIKSESSGGTKKNKRSKKVSQQEKDAEITAFEKQQEAEIMAQLEALQSDS